MIKSLGLAYVDNIPAQEKHLCNIYDTHLGRWLSEFFVAGAFNAEDKGQRRAQRPSDPHLL